MTTAALIRAAAKEMRKMIADADVDTLTAAIEGTYVLPPTVVRRVLEDMK